MVNLSKSPQTFYKRGFIEINKSTTKGIFLWTRGQNHEKPPWIRAIHVHNMVDNVDKRGQATSFGLSLLG
jgi:hypothetical protein